jgi:hypothetical protein
MTESPQEMHGVPPEEDIDEADVQDRLEQDPQAVPNAPNRNPSRDSMAQVEDPSEHPGPHDPGDMDANLPSGVESFEQPGRDGNWDSSTSDD